MPTKPAHTPGKSEEVRPLVIRAVQYIDAFRKRIGSQNASDQRYRRQVKAKGLFCNTVLAWLIHSYRPVRPNPEGRMVISS